MKSANFAADKESADKKYHDADSTYKKDLERLEAGLEADTTYTNALANLEAKEAALTAAETAQTNAKTDSIAAANNIKTVTAQEWLKVTAAVAKLDSAVNHRKFEYAIVDHGNAPEEVYTTVDHRYYWDGYLSTPRKYLNYSMSKDDSTKIFNAIINLAKVKSEVLNQTDSLRTFDPVTRTTPMVAVKDMKFEGFQQTRCKWNGHTNTGQRSNRGIYAITPYGGNPEAIKEESGDHGVVNAVVEYMCYTIDVTTNAGTETKMLPDNPENDAFLRAISALRIKNEYTGAILYPDWTFTWKNYEKDGFCDNFFYDPAQRFNTTTLAWITTAADIKAVVYNFATDTIYDNANVQAAIAAHNAAIEAKNAADTAVQNAETAVQNAETAVNTAINGYYKVYDQFWGKAEGTHKVESRNILPMSDSLKVNWNWKTWTDPDDIIIPTFDCTEVMNYNEKLAIVLESLTENSEGKYLTYYSNPEASYIIKGDSYTELVKVFFAKYNASKFANFQENKDALEMIDKGVQALVKAYEDACVENEAVIKAQETIKKTYFGEKTFEAGKSDAAYKNLMLIALGKDYNPTIAVDYAWFIATCTQYGVITGLGDGKVAEKANELVGKYVADSYARAAKVAENAEKIADLNLIICGLDQTYSNVLAFALGNIKDIDYSISDFISPDDYVEAYFDVVETLEGLVEKAAYDYYDAQKALDQYEAGYDPFEIKAEGYLNKLATLEEKLAIAADNLAIAQAEYAAVMAHFGIDF